MSTEHKRIDPAALLRQTGWLRALAGSLVGDPHRAEDIVQDTVLAALQEPPRGTGLAGARVVFTRH